MDVKFVPPISHGSVRRALDELLSNGTDRIMVACAFCSGAGAVIMRPHLARLRTPGSCLVVSADDPTDIDAVNALGAEAPGAVWIHTTGNVPRERDVGHALMHSKVFYSEAGDKCWLWVGSHNLTARATTGANFEAAILLAGHPSEEPFRAARRHIEECRDESSPCPVDPLQEPDGEPADVVVVHAETDELTNLSPPWHVGLGLRSAEYDWLLQPPADVRVHLYGRGELSRGWRDAVPRITYAGTLTGLNFTDIHPEYAGMAARWDDKHFSITEVGAVLQFAQFRPDTKGILTQAVINVESIAPSEEAFLPAKPKVERAESGERRALGWVDGDLAGFFTRASIRDGQLVYEIKHTGKGTWKMSIDDLREPAKRLLYEEANARQIDLFNILEEKRPRHPFIMRAKYRLQRGR